VVLISTHRFFYQSSSLLFPHGALHSPSFCVLRDEFNVCPPSFISNSLPSPLLRCPSKGATSASSYPWLPVSGQSSNSSFSGLVSLSFRASPLDEELLGRCGWTFLGSGMLCCLGRQEDNPPFLPSYFSFPLSLAGRRTPRLGSFLRLLFFGYFSLPPHSLLDSQK